MNDRTLELDESLVDIHPHANAFRVIPAGPDCFLDFLFWIPEENLASVVSRIRVRSGFLPFIRHRMTLALTEIGSEVLVH